MSPFQSAADFGHMTGDARKAHVASSASPRSLQGTWTADPSVVAHFIDSLPADLFTPREVERLRAWAQEVAGE